MNKAMVTEVTATSTQGFDYAVSTGIAHALEAFSNAKRALVEELAVDLVQQPRRTYLVHMRVALVLDN
jgi:flavin-binding protein dodecin